MTLLCLLICYELQMEKTAISLFMDGKSSELAKFMKGIKTDEVMVISKWKDYCIGFA